MARIIDIPGGRVASYSIVGTGQPTLMLAGGPGFAADYMSADAQLLSDTLHAHLIDPHGSGSSTPPADPADYSAAGHAAFYEQVRRALGLPQVLLLGHSFGATTALTYAAVYPDAVSACIAVAGAGLGPDADAAADGDAQAEFEAMLARHCGASWYPDARPVIDNWTELLLAAKAPAQMEAMMATVLPFYVAEPDNPQVAGRLAEMSRRIKADLAAGQAWESGLFQATDLRPLLGQITCPTLIVAGELDFVCGPAQARPLASGIAGARLVLLPGCGHLPSIEAPDQYRGAVLDFLATR